MAGQIDLARRGGAMTLQLNRDRAARATGQDHCRSGLATMLVSRRVLDMLAGRFNL